MKRLLTCFLVLLAALQVVYAGKPDLFSDWLHLQQKPAAAATPSARAATAGSYYEEAEFEHVCFQDTFTRNCRCIGCENYCNDPANPACDANYLCCQTMVYQSTLKCCSGDHGYGGPYDGERSVEDVFGSDIEIGECIFTQFSFPPGGVIQSGVPGIVQWGTFEAVCEVNGGGKCDHPFCDSLVLKWTGSAHKVDQAISLTNPTTRIDQSCGGSDVRRRLIGGRDIGQKVQQPRNATNKVPSGKTTPTAKVAYTDPSERTYFMSGADIYNGPVTISSRKYNIKYRHGVMQYVFWYADEAVSGVSAADAQGKRLVRPFVYDLHMQKPLEYY